MKCLPAAVLLVACCSPLLLLAQPPTADLILVGGHIVTMDPSRPKASAMAVKGDRILAVGSNDEILKYADAETRTIELQG